ncbi:MAG: rhodanese-like domain-containing protein [Myxococcaceae bacterium]|nr:rhodanese-like domain-containing protein [Myxococcaceae bacterium]MCI0672441.1 rhodanese-like domain-containing protein [Myxococcaceae bacterium]
MAAQSETSSKAHEMAAQGATLLDVRTPEEYVQGHLPGARNIPVQVLSQRLDDVGPRETPVIVYCAAGGRSATAAELLKRAGFREVLNLGPMSAW